MRKLFIIFFTLIFLFNNGCYYLLFNALQSKVQKEVAELIRKGMKEEDLTQVVVQLKGQSEISWIKPGKEFSYKGQLYDVVRSKINEHKVYYYCLNDQKEKQLVSSAHKLNETRKDIDKKVKRTGTDRYVPHKILLDNFIYPSDIKYTIPDIYLVSISLIIPSPPPKQA